MHSQERSNMIECITRQEITQHFCTEYENPEPCSTFVSKLFSFLEEETKKSVGEVADDD
jgi:hypothetical protein